MDAVGIRYCFLLAKGQVSGAFAVGFRESICGQGCFVSSGARKTKVMIVCFFFFASAVAVFFSKSLAALEA